VVEGGGVNDIPPGVEIGEVACDDEELSVGGGGDEDVDEDNDDEGGGSFAEELEDPHCWLVGSSLRRSMCAR